MGKERGELGGTAEIFCELCQNIIEPTIKKEELWNIDETGFVQKPNSRKVVVSKGSSNVWSKCADENFHMTFVKYVSSVPCFASAVTWSRAAPVARVPHGP